MNSSQKNNYNLFLDIASYQINKKTLNYDDKMYNILNYDENYISNNDYFKRLYRSVIISYPEKKLLAVAPCKTIPFHNFKNIYPTIDNIVIHQYIDGNILQLFFDNRINKWVLAYINSDSNIGTMFNKELSKIFIRILCGDEDKELNDLAFLEYLDKDININFMLKYQNTCQNSLYIISVHRISNLTTNTIEIIPYNEYINFPLLKQLNGIICFPKQHIIHTSYNEFIEDIDNYTANKYILTNELTGYQTSISSEEYKLMKNSNSIYNQNKYEYLCLLRINKVKDITSVFSKYKQIYFKCYQLYDQFIRQVHQSYIDYYIKKNISELPIKYKYHVEKFHKIYINNKNKNIPFYITKPIIQDYFNKINPFELMNILNFYEYYW